MTWRSYFHISLLQVRILRGDGIEDSIDLTKTKSIGLKLVRRLTSQLQGKLDYQKDEGAFFQVFFMDQEMRSKKAIV